MKSFLAKNWLLIVIPVLIVAIAIAVILGLESPDEQAGFRYPL